MAILNKMKKIVPPGMKLAMKVNALKFNSKIFNASNVTFSQCSEDVVLRNIFGHRAGGFYIDVGAFHPVLLSNTFYFYKYLDWRGINIDPRPGSMKLFEKHRPGDINLEIGIGCGVDTLTYYFLGDNCSMNSFSKEFLEKEEAWGQVKKEIKIGIYSLEEVIEKYKPPGKEIDFLSVDTEGMDLDVLKSGNWNKHRPKIIVLEMFAGSINSINALPESEFLAGKDYHPVSITYLSGSQRNVFFKSDEWHC